MADIRRAEVEILIAVVGDADRVEEFAVQELDASDRTIDGFEVFLHERSAIGSEIERRSRGVKLLGVLEPAHQRT